MPIVDISNDSPLIDSKKLEETSESKEKGLLPRQESRVICVQFLYFWDTQRDYGTHTSSELLELFVKEMEVDSSLLIFAESLALGTTDNIGTIDKTIEKYADNWTLDRIAKIDLAILRLAIYELYYRDDIPPIVTINEAIELGKLFSGEDSKRFINGILDKLKENLERPLRSAKK